MLDIAVLCLGLVGLWAGTELTIRGALRISEHFRLSQMFIGLTILAFGTDLPELVVSINGALRNLRGIESSGIVVGNAVGSSVCQVTIVLGTAAICHRLAADAKQIGVMTSGLIGSCLLLFFVGIPTSVGPVGGIVLVSVFAIYVIVLYRQERDGQITNQESDQIGKNIWASWMFVGCGMALVIFSSELVLEKALRLVEMWQIRQSFVGAVIVAFGTSLPELALTVTAAWKNKPGLSLGNVVGSNIFDCLVPVGVAACIAPLKFDAAVLRFDLPYLFLVSALFSWFVWSGKGLQRHAGVCLCILFFGYVALKLGMA